MLTLPREGKTGRENPHFEDLAGMVTWLLMCRKALRPGMR